MTQTVENLYQEIGQAALECAGVPTSKLLVYAEVEDGVISADIFYVNQAGLVQFRFCPKSMQALIYALWERWQEDAANREWRVMCYVIDGAKFSIDLTYPDQIKNDEDLSERRPLAVKKYFGDMTVDYSKPR